MKVTNVYLGSTDTSFTGWGKKTDLNTKDLAKILTAFGLSGKKNLFVLEELNKNVYLSSRNLKNSSVVINSELNTYGISNANNLIISEGAVPKIESLLNR